MTKFNVGDRVKKMGSDGTFKRGHEYVVREVGNDWVHLEGVYDGINYKDHIFELVDSLASTIAAVKKGDRVTVRTKVAAYTEFKVSSSGWGIIISVGGEVAINWSEIVELTITKPALPPEPAVGAIVKFTEAGEQQWQIHTYKGWLSIYFDGAFSNVSLDWAKTFNGFGPEFEVIREGGK